MIRCAELVISSGHKFLSGRTILQAQRRGAAPPAGDAAPHTISRADLGGGPAARSALVHAATRHDDGRSADCEQHAARSQSAELPTRAGEFLATIAVGSVIGV